MLTVVPATCTTHRRPRPSPTAVRPATTWCARTRTGLRARDTPLTNRRACHLHTSHPYAIPPKSPFSLPTDYLCRHNLPILCTPPTATPCLPVPYKRFLRHGYPFCSLHHVCSIACFHVLSSVFCLSPIYHLPFCSVLRTLSPVVYAQRALSSSLTARTAAYYSVCGSWCV